MSATVAADAAGCKHMFGTTLDFERSFGEPKAMHRTYVRRRLTVFATATVLVMALGGPMARALGVVSDPLVPVSSSSYVVRHGDTLWSIASRIAPDRDPREVIAELERRNEAATGGLVPGQVLSIPSPS